jgi:hypothetical protein
MSQLTSENQIQADVEDLKARFSHTQELYREVAALLFFRYGIAPTANKLYQYVRKGSMTAPAEALGRFWADLREKSRVRIQAPGLPDELSAQAGNLVATLWDLAHAKAQDSLAALRDDVEAQLITIRLELEKAQTAETVSRTALEAQRQTNTELTQQLKEATAAKFTLEARLSASDEERELLRQAVKESRESFGQELEKVRMSLHSIEARSEAEIKRCLLEIDRERTLAGKVTQELGATKASMAKLQAANKVETTKLHGQVSNLREDLGKRQGQLVQLKAQLVAAQKQLVLVNATRTKAASKVKAKATSAKAKT